jgi:hypothetical protein
MTLSAMSGNVNRVTAVIVENKAGPRVALRSISATSGSPLADWSQGMRQCAEKAACANASTWLALITGPA